MPRMLRTSSSKKQTTSALGEGQAPAAATTESHQWPRKHSQSNTMQPNGLVRTNPSQAKIEQRRQGLGGVLRAAKRTNYAIAITFQGQNGQIRPDELHGN